MENHNSLEPEAEICVNIDKNDLGTKVVDENTNCIVIGSSDDKCNLTQTGDLCDLTLSSFNDFLLGDCSYFPDVFVSDLSGDFTEKSTATNQLHKNDLNELNDENPLKSDELLISKNDSIDYACDVDGFIKGDKYNFYHVFEVIENPSTETSGDVDTQNGLSEIGKAKFKAHRNSRKNKKRGATTAIKKGQRYLQNFKQKVLDYASNHTFKATALHFNINCNTLTEWARESKRLSLQQKSTTIPDSVCHLKTETVHSPSTKTDIILVNDSFTIETELNGNALKKIEQDLPLGDMRCDERFLKWIKGKRLERKELTRNEIYYAAQYCFNKFSSSTESPEWFTLWLKRYDKALKNSEKSDHETEKYIMYPNGFKIEVASYAKLFTKNSAARVFNVPRRRIFDWFKYSHSQNDSKTLYDNNVTDPTDESYDQGPRAQGGPKREKSRREIDRELQHWYQKRFSEGFSPTSKEIKAKAREMFAANGIVDLKFSEGWLQKFCKRLNIKLRYTDDNRLLLWILTQFDDNVSLSHQEITDESVKLIGKRNRFKGSKGWTLRFLKRHSKFLQRIPTVTDKLPDIFENDINEFRSQFKSTVSVYNVQSSCIGCMDEVPICFNYPQDGKNSSQPLLRKTGFENCQAVVFLCMLADGRVLPPTVVLKGSGTRQIFPLGMFDMLILYREDGVVDLGTVETWLADTWMSYVSSPSVLIVDSFKPHRMSELNEKLVGGNCALSLIPKGCSSQLQPLDVEVTPKFRDLIKKQWTEFQSNEMGNSSKRCRYPDQDTTLRWIGNAYREIKQHPHSIINSFRVIGLVD